jgi:benzoate membrane transport protein
MLKSLPPAHSFSSALIATLVGFGGTIALVVQALRLLGASVEQTSSAVTALCLGIGIGGLALSLKTRMPIVLAWSTPGAALLAAATPGIDWHVTVGVFVCASLLMILLGLVPVLGALAEKIPGSIASAMLAGVLLPFCLRAFKLGTVDPLLVAVLVSVFIVARRFVSLYALLLVLGAGVALALVRGQVGGLPDGPTFGALLPTLPSWDPRAIVSLAVPLFLVTLVGQNLPGLMVLRHAGYQPAKPGSLIVGTGVMSLLTAPFGAHAVNLAAITAAICTGDDAHPDRAQRWKVGVIYGAMYLSLAVFAPSVVRLFLALPDALIGVLTGLALVPALVGAIANMLTVTEERDAAILTFLATGSGLVLFGLGAAFWGLLVGAAALGARAWLRRSPP